MADISGEQADGETQLTTEHEHPEKLSPHRRYFFLNCVRHKLFI